VYASDEEKYALINIRLSGHAVTATLAAIDRTWAATGNRDPINRFLLRDYLQNLYITVLRQSQAFAICALIATSLAFLGLVGLAAALAERRVKEIGIRKAIGAGTTDILRLLLWQFTQPVIWASLLAWPIIAILMNHWLQGFAYHIALNPLLFVLASALALAVTLLTVSTHCYLVARAKPVAALRYE
jgi:putative ABC transport system permease protein